MSEDGWPHNQPGLKVASRLPAEGRTAACHLINRPLKFRIGVWYKKLRAVGIRPKRASNGNRAAVRLLVFGNRGDFVDPGRQGNPLAFTGSGWRGISSPVIVTAEAGGRASCACKAVRCIDFGQLVSGGT